MDNLQWTPTHAELQKIMRREITTLRELLDNLQQEESMILKKETTYWSHLIHQRGLLLKQLSDLRESRFFTIEALKHKSSQKDSSLEQLLPLKCESSWEILSLRDQILTLIDRMSLQSSRNEMLTHLAQHQPRQKKIEVATEDFDHYNGGDAI
jgi:hypothetical protein